MSLNKLLNNPFLKQNKVFTIREKAIITLGMVGAIVSRASLRSKMSVLRIVPSERFELSRYCYFAHEPKSWMSTSSNKRVFNYHVKFLPVVYLFPH